MKLLRERERDFIYNRCKLYIFVVYKFIDKSLSLRNFFRKYPTLQNIFQQRYTFSLLLLFSFFLFHKNKIKKYLQQNSIILFKMARFSNMAKKVNKRFYLINNSF